MFKLEKLCANKDSFHTINFKNGLNVIMGKPIKKNAENKKSTTNGIGKSLIIKMKLILMAKNTLSKELFAIKIK